MPGQNILESYLISVSAAADLTSFRNLQNILKQSEASVTGSVGNIAKTVLGVQVAIVGAFGALGAAVIGFADRVAQQDQQYRLFGLRMFTTAESARKLKIAMDSLGATMEEIAWDPELHQRFLESLRLQTELEQKLGVNSKENLRAIRDLRQEYSLLEQIFEYGGIRFVSTLFEKLGFNMGDLKEKFKEFNDYLVDKMPRVVDSIAGGLIPVLRDGWDVMKNWGMALKAIATGFTNIIGLLSGDKAIQGAVFSFENLAKAFVHVAHAAAIVANIISNLFEGLGDIASGNWKGLNEAWSRDPTKMFSKGDANSGLTSAMRAITGPEVFAQAERAGAALGVNPRLVYEQWAHETGNFTNRGSQQLNNFGGIRVPGSTEYQSFASPAAYTDYYIKLLESKRYAGIRGSQNEEQFAGALKRGGYYEDSYDHYLRGMKSAGANMQVNVGGIHVTQPNATPNQIQAAVAAGIQTAMKRQSMYDSAQLSPGY